MNHKLLTGLTFIIIIAVIIVFFFYKQSIAPSDTSCDNFTWERRVLNCTQNTCYVQDFIKSGEKLTDPFVIHKDHVGCKEYPEYFDIRGVNVLPIIGKVTVWYPSGEKYSHQNFDEQGKLEGKQFFWYKNGQKKSEETYHQGLLDGNSKTWYPNGQRATLVSATQGKYSMGVNWYENGVKKLEYTFQPTRVDKFWYENGQKKMYIYYKDNTHVKTEMWDKQGNTVTK